MVAFRFDPGQAYQREAIDAVLDLFVGQEVTPGGGPVELGAGTRGDLVFANHLDVAPAAIEKNLRRVQDRPNAAGTGPAIPLALRQDFVPSWEGLDFSVEMETGTGKTYVFLRTIAELHRRFGYAKFVIVVPTVAVREGVLSALRQLTDHLRELYAGLQLDHAVWDPAKPAGVRQFATAAHLQLLVIGIDSFTTDTNILNRVDPDRLNGYAPIEFLRACRPIVVLDEPQNLETPTRRAAIAALTPLFRLRYSATHRDPQHLVHRLTPGQAHDLGLVKRIGVVAVTRDAGRGAPPVEVVRVRATSRGVTARARIAGATRSRSSQVTLRAGADPFAANGRDRGNGWMVREIRAGSGDRPGVVEFSNGHVVEESGNHAPDQQREMIRQAVRAHFETEVLLDEQHRAGVLPATLKPLTLFFIDRVAHYHSPEGKFRRWFLEAYAEFRADPRFSGLELPETHLVHDGYFATTSTGTPKDLRVDAQSRDAESAFARIIRNKERLLGPGEPLRFIFSHSALAEGWDNPNVFTICNLQEGSSVLRKRQQIGRGLRLPVLADGTRCRHPEVNLLTVIAHESFTAFAVGLQREIEDDTGVAFEGRITDVTDRPVRAAAGQDPLDPALARVWRAIEDAVDYDLRFDTDAIVDRVVAQLRALDPPAQFRVTAGELRLGPEAVTTVSTAPACGPCPESVVTERAPLADPVGELCRRVPLSRATMVRILRRVDLDAASVDSSAFVEQVAESVSAALADLMHGGISYRPVEGRWIATLANGLPPTGEVPIELPRAFEVTTPLGTLRPARAYLEQSRDGPHLLLTIRALSLSRGP